MISPDVVDRDPKFRRAMRPKQSTLQRVKENGERGLMMTLLELVVNDRDHPQQSRCRMAPTVTKIRFSTYPHHEL